MSIHPEYAERILNGDKTVEFRRTRMREDVSHIVIYATAPRQVLVGAFEVRAVDEATPKELWRRHRTQAGIDEDTYRSYFGSSARAFAIEVGEVFALDRPASLDELGLGLRAPQSYCYVDETVLDAVIRRARERRPGSSG